jgi:FAD/FMN-containing dehydrogenase
VATAVLSQEPALAARVDRSSPGGRTVSSVDVDGLVREMEGIVGPEYVSTVLFEKVKSTLDVFPYEVERDKLPHAVVMPKDTQQISAIMRYANHKAIPVYVRGSGTSFTGAARYQHAGIVLNTFRMQGYALFEDLGYFECETGTICNDLALHLEEKGYFLPFAPGSRLIASLGGLVANNTSAHLNDACIGKPSDYIMGLEAVLPDGEVIKTGTAGIRRIAGTDLTKFFVGSDGLLGVITRFRMRLVPNFKKAYGIAVFGTLTALGQGVKRMYREKCPIPIFMEFMEYETAKIGYDLKGLGDPRGSVIFFVNIGRTREEAEAGLELVLKAFAAENPLELRAVTDMAEWEALWATREVIGSFLMQSTQNQWVSLEIVSNLRDLVECLEEANHFNRDLPLLGDLKNYLFGHIGSLTMHPGVIIPKEWNNETKEMAINEKFQREMEMNLKYGTCGGEWGQFAKRTEFFKRMYGDVGFAFMTKIKQAIDPKNILNRGVLEGY